MEATGTGWGRHVLLAIVLVTAAVGLPGCIGNDQTARIAASAVGCTDASSAQNRLGQFQYGGAASCKSGTETFDWENPTPRARIQYGSALAEGEIAIEIQDGAERLVYEGTAAPGAEGRQGTSELGVPTAGSVGTWTIELTFENVTGNLGLQIHVTR